MSRPKGSKNKATLAKELGMSLEEYQKKYNTSTDKDNTSSLKSTDNTTKVSKGAEHPNITSNTRFLVPKEGNNSLKSVKDKDEGAESTINSSPILTEDNCKEVLHKLLKVASGERIAKKGYVFCDKCGKEVLKDSTSYLDLSRMLGIGDYHFKILTKLRLCHDCLLALAKSMEENLYEDGLGVILKTDDGD